MKICPSHTALLSLSSLLAISTVSGYYLTALPMRLPRRTTAASPAAYRRRSAVAPNTGGSSTALSSDFGSDFASAMPPKPELSTEEKMWESADQFIRTMSKCLGEGVEAPPELDALQKALDDKSDPQLMALRIYELMIERGMLYDEEAETGTLTPTEFDIKANLDIKEVRDEFAYLYKYGMMLMERGLVSEDDLKNVVIERLISRTGLSPEEFDKWLGYAE